MDIPYLEFLNVRCRRVLYIPHTTTSTHEKVADVKYTVEAIKQVVYEIRDFQKTMNNPYI